MYWDHEKALELLLRRLTFEQYLRYRGESLILYFLQTFLLSVLMKIENIYKR